MHEAVTSPIINTRKVSYSPKHSQNRETTHVKQINVADFAKLQVKTVKSPEATPTTANLADYQQRVNKVRFKGASNSVPNYNEKQDNIKKTVAQNDALLASSKQPTTNHKSQNPIHVRKIEPKSPSKAALLLPTTGQYRNQLMEMISTDNRMDTSAPDVFPRMQYGSPTPLHNQYNGSDDEMSGEISIVVPKLPQLNRPRTEIPTATNEIEEPETNVTQPNKYEPVVIVTNDEVPRALKKSKQEREGWESGYNSMTPRLSVDSRSHALITPTSGVIGGSAMLEIPNEHRSLTPFSTITNSTYLDHSRPQSTFLEVPHLAAECHDPNSRKLSLELRPSMGKLPAIFSKNDDTESTRLDFTPLPLQSIRTSDGELSD